MRTNGTRVLEYDDENQLIRITEPDAWKSEFVYDGQLRRRIRREYEWHNSAWVQTNEVRYIYDGNLVIQERDRLNVPKVTYTRGRDLSDSLEGAGGIGGLLARTDNALAAIGEASATVCYHADGNGNVTCLVDANQTVVARYVYDPFGNTLSATGPMAEANLYRFSSKELHAGSGLIYYHYRYYDPNLQRWPNRDPIHEWGGKNLYRFVGNEPVAVVDLMGLAGFGDLKVAEARHGQVDQEALNSILENAIDNVDSHDWAYVASYTNFGHVFNRGNKCNLFVWAMVQKCGHNVPTNFFRNKYPPLARHLGDSNTPIPGFIITNRPVPGAIMSDGVHVAIVAGSNCTISANAYVVVSNDWGFRLLSGPSVYRVPVK